MAKKRQVESNGKKDDVASDDGGKVVSKRRFTLPIAVAVAVILIAASAVYFFMLGGSSHQEPLSALITDVEGTVLLQSGGRAVSVPAEKGMELKAGDIVTTSGDSLIEVEFEDGSISRAGPDTRMVFSDLYRHRDGSEVVVISIEPGRLWNSVKEITGRNSRFEVHTPTSVAGVRGTAFSVEVKENALQQDEAGSDDSGQNGKQAATYRVYEGEIGVAGESRAGDDIIIGSGQQGSAEEGRPVAPAESLKVLEVDEWEKDNLVEDLPPVFVEVETEVKTVLIEIAEEQTSQKQQHEQNLQSELQLLREQFSAETDPVHRAELQELIEIIEEEYEMVEELLSILQEEKDELLEGKERLETLLNTINENKDVLDRESLHDLVRDETRLLWEEEKERSEKRQERRDRMSGLEENIARSRTYKEELSGQAGIDLSDNGEEETEPEESAEDRPAAEQPRAREPEETRPAPNPEPDRRGVASDMTISTQPSGVTSGKTLTPAPAVRVVDAYGNPVSGARVTVSPNRGRFDSGTLTKSTNARGTAVFDNLVIGQAGSYRLNFSASGVSTVTSGSFSISPADPAQAVITVQPSGSAAGSTISPSPAVRITDNFGNPLSGIRVTAEINKGRFGPGSTRTVTTSDKGTAVFSNLVIQAADSNYRLTFKASGIAGTGSNSFNISPASVDSGQSDVSYTSPVTAGNNNITMNFIARDRFGNPVSGSQNVIVSSSAGTWFSSGVNFTNGTASITFTVDDPGSYSGVNVSVGGTRIGSYNISVQSS